MNTAPDFVVVDVETSGFDPAAARVLSVAALTLTADGSIEHSMYTLLNPGVDPGPTNIHGLTPAMLAGQPCYADIAEHLAPLLRGRILVAHNAAFDYAFLAAEARRCDTELPVTSVLCTLELAGLLDLGLDSLSLAALARHWNIPQARPHDALDDARVLAAVLRHALVRAAELEITLPIRSPATLPPVQFHERGRLTLRFRSSAPAFGHRVAARRYRRRMQDSYSQVSRPHLVRLYAANVACALIAGLCVALPVTGAAFAVALGASCADCRRLRHPHRRRLSGARRRPRVLGRQPPCTSVCIRSGR